MGDGFLVQKLPSCLFMCLTIIMFCAGSNPIFPLCFPFKLWWFSVMALFLPLHFVLISHHFYGLYYYLFFRDVSLKSQELSALFFRHISMDLFYLIFSLKYPCKAIILFRWFIRLFIRYYSFIIRIFLYFGYFIIHYFFKLFSCSYLFIYFVFVVLC